MRKTSYSLSSGNFLLLFIPLVVGLLFTQTVKGQNFNYSFAKDSVAWQELNTQTILNTNNSAWNFTYKIPIGFSFEYLGQSFDSLSIEGNGRIVFDNDRNFSFWGLVDYVDVQDSAGNFSVLGYQLSGNAGSRQLVIQFKNVAATQDPMTLASYQVILRENNAIAFQMGSYILSESLTPSIFDPVAIGLVNQNMNTSDRALTLSGPASSPSAILVNDNVPDITYLFSLPTKGTRYTFSPNF